jgi:GTPase SAR1 family protein
MNAKKKPWNRSKLILCGQGSAGKTSLFKGFLNLDFEMDQKSTVALRAILEKLRVIKIGEIFLNMHSAIYQLPLQPCSPAKLLKIRV